MLAVANEVTRTVGLFTAVPADGAASLALMHNNDGESSLLPATVTQSGVTTTYGSVAAFKTGRTADLTIGCIYTMIYVWTRYLLL